MGENGLLDFIRTPEGQGLLAATFGGLASAGRGGTLNTIGRAGIAGLGGYSSAVEAQEARQYKDAQLREAKLKQDREKQKLESLPTFFNDGKVNHLAGLQAGYTPADLKAMAELQNAGRAKVARTVKGMEGGREVEYQVDDFGQRVGDGMAQYRAPLEVALGDKKSFVDPFSLGKVADFTMGQSPDSRASVAATMRGQNMTDARARERLTFDQGGAGEGGAGQAQFIKQFGKPSTGYRWKADGSQEFIPGGPADQKAQLQKSGEGTVGSVVADLRDKYGQLSEGGGIVSTQNKVGTNIAARIGSTGLGQALGGAVGTKNQSARESIAMTRPLLLQSIMKATGMSAKQMDSNAELKLYLATATDPEKGLEANLQALDRIESLYGGGATESPARAVVKAGQGGATGGWGIKRVD